MHKLRPLPLHLANAQLCWGGAGQAASQWLAGDLSWHPDLAGEVAALRRKVNAVGAGDFVAAVLQASSGRMQDLLAGVAAYQAHPWQAPERKRTVLVRHGTVQLFDYGGTGRPLLLVPSMINPPDILDLMPGCSLVRYLSRAGFRPLLLDWGGAEQSDERTRLTLATAVTEGLLPAIRAVANLAGGSVDMIGYCMGGTLALAAAALAPDAIHSLALLAAPYDFHADSAFNTARVDAMAQIIAGLPAGAPVPVDLLQLYFTALDPTLNDRKFRRFAHMDQSSEAAAFFVALETWANGGAPLPRAVAEECLTLWYKDNQPVQGRWTVDGQQVDPAGITAPVFLAAPKGDRLVPQQGALALANHLLQPTIVTPNAGHVGMVVGRSARKGLWEPLTAWLSATGKGR